MNQSKNAIKWIVGIVIVIVICIINYEHIKDEKSAKKYYQQQNNMSLEISNAISGTWVDRTGTITLDISKSNMRDALNTPSESLKIIGGDVRLNNIVQNFSCMGTWEFSREYNSDVCHIFFKWQPQSGNINNLPVVLQAVRDERVNNGNPCLINQYFMFSRPK